MGYKGEVPDTDRGVESRRVAVREGVVYWIHFAVTTGDGTLRLRDGADESGEILITLKIDAGMPGMTRFSPPLPYQKGLFVERVDHIQDWTIAFDRLE